MQQSPLDPLEVLATNSAFTDPAIDTSESDDPEVPSSADRLAKYRADRDLAHLVLNGSETTRFVCKPISRAFALKVLDGLPLHLARVSAFLVGCHEIRQPEGKVLAPRKLSAGKMGTSIPQNEDEWLNRVIGAYGAETIYEIGSVIYDRARAPEAALAPFSYLGG